MIEEEGIVVDCMEGRALVKTEGSSACKGCASVELCRPVTDESQNIVETENPIGAVKGDKVIIVAETKELLKASLIVYLVPLILFIVGVLIGEIVGEAGIFRSNKDLLAGLFGFAMLIVAFAGIRIFGKRRERGGIPLPKIARILRSGIAT